MYNPLNAELMLLQADELHREMRAARQTTGSRRWWRRERDAQAAHRAR